MGEKTSRAGRPSVASTTELSNHIVAEVRDSFGKGYARRLRAAGQIPAVLYGHGTKPQHLALPGHETALLLRKANAILELEIDGKTQTGLVKDVQKDPVRQIIEHVDLIVIRKGEKVEVDVAVHVVGESAPGTSVDVDAHSLLVEAPAVSIPANIEVSVEGLEDGASIYAKDVTLPEGVTLVVDPETLVLAVKGETEQDLGDESDQEAAAEASAAE
ncbi:50S ribosomal protein L25/general stress protein Ctc [Salinibacterium sp. dk2585]|uniref:50S ribosomal protein L25/general stress protein Ctc n=1 Tax=unclassified Salinibacterium TaxID=2632331 RepID=UPI0011C2566C|nr:MULTISPECIES: 50S ribosomal protein L25/general stress protein Ctc [unclassified Salinibacterium]QEE61956.1 50S ribosomal protein L25/general stress protein Ctc [Salinibacterium sp. dk2585]TXK54489.1 50S ribosomal protein L25/general stress protein Ctc [Salinibacterium sp. dk5596]